jgi:hypothetical protein
MSPLQQQEGAWRITGRRCEPVKARLPQSDWMTADLEAEEELMRWTRTDWIGAIVIVALTLLVSHYFPGVWFAGWLK